jgi:hypothetical protein
MFLAGLGISIAVGATIGGLVGGAVTAYYGGSAGDILTGAAVGAGLGALGGAIGFVSFAGVSAIAGLALGEIATFWVATFLSGAITGGTMNGLNAWWDGADPEDIVWEIAEGGIVGAASAGIFGILFRGGGAALSRLRPNPPAQAPPTSTIAPTPPPQQVGPNFRAGNRVYDAASGRWHLPNGTPPSRIPAADPVGDALETAVQNARANYTSSWLESGEQRAIEAAQRAGDYGKATVLERMFRGWAIQRQVQRQFPQLTWAQRGQAGLDACDVAATPPIWYEITTDTMSALESHARREAGNFFRFIIYSP